MEKDLTQFAFLILCNDSTGFDEMGDYLPMIDILYEVDLNIIKALGLVVSDKKIFKVFIMKTFF